jgi:hypothetical protein
VAGDAELDAYHRRNGAVAVLGALVDAHAAGDEPPSATRVRISFSAHFELSVLWNETSSGTCMVLTSMGETNAPMDQRSITTFGSRRALNGGNSIRLLGALSSALR